MEPVRRVPSHDSPVATFDTEVSLSAKELKKARKRQEKERKKAAKVEKEQVKERPRETEFGQTEFEQPFENPLAGGAQQDQNGSCSPSASMSATRTVSQDWGESVHFDHKSVERFEADGESNRDKNLGKAGWSHIFMTTGVLLLLPFYVGFALFMGWVVYIVPNPISALGAAVAISVPCVLWIGRQGTKKGSEKQLQMFSFLMLLVITLQISIAVVVGLDDGTLVDAYLELCAEAARKMCANVNDLPVGGDYIPLGAVCGCADQVISSASSGQQDLATCLREYARTTLNIQKRDLMAGMLLTLVIETLMSWLAWGMMVDLDMKDARQAAKRKGGGPTGTLRGTIVCGTRLLSRYDTLPEQANEKQLKALGAAMRLQYHHRKKQSDGSALHKTSDIRPDTLRMDLSTRRVELALYTPGLDEAVSHHTRQTAGTQAVEDDRDPDFQYQFGGIRTYKASRELQISVYDFSSPTGPIHVGSATVEVDQDGKLPEYNYSMDGDPASQFVRIPLTWSDDSQQTQSAGTVVLKLIWVPQGEVIIKNIMMVTQTWYFELTVVGMVGLSMLILAYQSPAQPPPVIALGALRVLEVFCATHLVVEMLMELSVAVAAKRVREQLRSPWFLLAVIVLICNWLSLLRPSMSMGLVPDKEAGWGMEHNISGTQSAGRSLTAAANAVLSNAMAGGRDAGMGLSKLISVGRVFRIVRPIRTLRMISNIDVVVSVLADSLGLFATVCGLLLFLLAMFALVGMSSFGGALQYQCIGEPGLDADKPRCSPEQIASAKLMKLSHCPLPCPATLACANEPNAHTWCAPLQEGTRPVGGDRFGYRDFDNFWRAIITMFVQTTGDGGMHTIPLALHAAGCTSDTAAWVISFAGSVCLNLLALNLFLAITCSAYSDAAARTLQLATERREFVESRRLEIVAKETEEERLNRESAEAQQIAKLSIAQQIEELSWAEQGAKYARTRDTLKLIIDSIWFERFTSTVIIGNTFTMAVVHEGMDDTLNDSLKIFEAIFLLCFIVEALVKVTGLGKTLYWQSVTNRFDLFVILCSVVGYVVTFFESEVRDGLGLDPEAFVSLRAIRLLRALQVIRLLSRQKALLLVLKTIGRAWKPLLIHSGFCLFSMSMFSVIGMHAFGGSLGPAATVDDYDTEISANFETFGRGLLTVFEMTVGEDWSYTMYWYTRFAGLAHNLPESFVQITFVLMYIWCGLIVPCSPFCKPHAELLLEYAAAYAG
eukprot:COSAG02_NODE_852_length_16531_cov_9.899586_1_plen_1228_part_00